MSSSNPDPKPMTGPEHVREALRLAELAEQHNWPLEGGSFVPTEDRRHRTLLRAHLHASLARTAAMVDATRHSGGNEYRAFPVREAWHEAFNVAS